MIVSIYLNQEIPFEEVKETILELFPDFVIFEYGDGYVYSDEMKWSRIDHVLLSQDSDFERKDFQYAIRLESGYQKESDERLRLHIARFFSEKFQVRTLAEYMVENDDYIYYNILFENGKTYLADDYCDGPTNHGSAKGIEIIREITIPHFRFDSTGDCIEIINNDEI